eukprot:CAMPEP_0184415582 /NCGR_PEP_ID=MMETSP0738-20130409/8836_1 /TAXON_ID=385413 /ORGANISM="Thalassiosira miniscula, Strain CCMP1093" /LENGTH=33 /DNA_ID= /DNA_START= /DNA_END= /DNA_ORIENTATION=
MTTGGFGRLPMNLAFTAEEQWTGGGIPRPTEQN